MGRRNLESGDTMQIGNYIRTKDGKIGKITYINKDKTAIITDYITNSNIPKCIGVTKIEKIKNNIIDLLKPMDLMYIDIDNGYEGGIIVPRIAETQNELNSYIEKFKSGELILKYVVTYEQLLNNRYEVK